MDSFPPPPNEEELVGDEEEAPGNQIVVRATIESSSESGDDQLEETIESHRNSVPNIQAVEEIRSSLNQENDKDSLNENLNGVVTHSDEKDDQIGSHSDSSETTPEQLEENINQILSVNDAENVEGKDDEDTHSTKSISSDAIHNIEANEASDVNSVEASEWNNKMANMSNSIGSRSISHGSLKNGNENESNDKNNIPVSTPLGPGEMKITKDTIVSKENVKIEVTRERKKTLPNSDEYVDESVDVSPPMPAPRTVTPVSEVCNLLRNFESHPVKMCGKTNNHLWVH